jgi:tripartite-type tricarboxylate transporter receptor subunit TctC
MVRRSVHCAPENDEDFGMTKTGMLSRRKFLASTCIGAPMLLRTGRSRAAESNYPARNIDFIIPYAPGGSVDAYVRVVAPVLEKYLPHPVNVTPINVAGGGGAKGVVQLYRSRPDGYTIGVCNIPGAFILQQLQANSAYDLEEMNWIGVVGDADHYVLAVGANSPLRSFDDLKALSDEREVKFSVTGPEGTGYAATVIGTELLGIRTRLITGYRGSADYIIAAIRGDCDAVIAGLPNAVRFAAGGDLRILASFERESSIPGVPDATALGQPDLDQITIERPVGGPPGLPAEIRSTLSDAFARALRDPVVLQWAEESGLPMPSRTPAEVAALVARQRVFFDRWKDVLLRA